MAPVFVTGADVLAHVGAPGPSAYESEWADLVAGAINDGITARLGAAWVAPDPLPSELLTAARIAAAEAYKRREVSFGVMAYADLQGQAYRIARDYLTGVEPIADRYRTEWGIA